uniref:ATP synthase complex subunit 8 n=1 Tax=Suragina sp. KW-2016 TaxID=1812714 RepID=A0A164R3T8_9DIPT|nr:ATP synthase F0 subunit 8 [Suragina sp. KW-2016]
MPQMAPISWLLLFIIFSITFVLFNMTNYFFFILNPKKSEMLEKKKSNSLNWKW